MGFNLGLIINRKGLENMKNEMSPKQKLEMGLKQFSRSTIIYQF